MKKFFWLIPLLCSLPMQALPAFVTSGHGTTGGADCTVTLSVTSGQFAVATVSSNSLPAANPTISNTDSDIFVQATSSPYTDGTTAIVSLWASKLGTTNASEVFDMNVKNTTNFASCVVAIYSGLATSSFWDQAVAGNNNTATTTPSSGTTGTTSQASELAIGVLAATMSAGSPTFTGTNGYTFRDSGVGPTSTCVLVDNILSSTGTQQATLTVTGGATATGAMIVATLKAPAAAGSKRLRGMVISP